MKEVLDIWGRWMATLTNNDIGLRANTCKFTPVTVWPTSVGSLDSSGQDVWSSWHDLRSKYAKIVSKWSEQEKTSLTLETCSTALWELGFASTFWLSIVNLGQVCSSGKLLHVSVCKMVMPGGKEVQMRADNASSKSASPQIVPSRYLSIIWPQAGGFINGESADGMHLENESKELLPSKTSEVEGVK